MTNRGFYRTLVQGRKALATKSINKSPLRWERSPDLDYNSPSPDRRVAATFRLRKEAD